MEKNSTFYNVKANKRKTDKSVASLLFKIFAFIILFAYAISLILPMVWSFVVSFQTPETYLIELKDQFSFYSFSQLFNMQNYVEVLSYFEIQVMAGVYVDIGGLILNSIMYSVGSALFQTLACCLMAYIVARFNFISSKIIYTVVLIVMVLPIVGALPSQVQVLDFLGLYDTMTGLIILSSNFYGIHFLILHASFKTIPKDFNEAAMIDGAGQWRIMLTIMIPLVKNALLTIFLLKFIAFWNDYQTPLLFAKSYPTLAYGLHWIQNGSGNHTDINLNTDPHKLAAAMLIFIPILVLFMFTHKRLMGNIAAGGIKG